MEEFPNLDIVDIAYQIIDMHKENEYLRREVEHYKKMHEQSCKSTSESIKHNKEMIGTILSAALDPDSLINKGLKANIKESLG